MYKGVVARIIGLFKDYLVARHPNVVRKIGFAPVFSYVATFFDGVIAQGDGGVGFCYLVVKIMFFM